MEHQQLSQRVTRNGPPVKAPRLDENNRPLRDLTMRQNKSVAGPATVSTALLAPPKPAPFKVEIDFLPFPSSSSQHHHLLPTLLQVFADPAEAAVTQEDEQMKTGLLHGPQRKVAGGGGLRERRLTALPQRMEQENDSAAGSSLLGSIDERC